MTGTSESQGRDTDQTMSHVLHATGSTSDFVMLHLNQLGLEDLYDSLLVVESVEEDSGTDAIDLMKALQTDQTAAGTDQGTCDLTTSKTWRR